MSDYLGTTHYEHPFNADEAFEMVEKVIYHLETYEPELIRSAIPNFLLAQMTSKHVKMVLTGEGSDELFGGYLYFREAPDASAFQKELRRIFHHLHNVNCQRADRMTMAHGLEARVPFLCPNVIEEIMKINPKHKFIHDGRPAEKHILREAFQGTMPDEVLWRTKAMQCEGIGMTWVAELQHRCGKMVADEDFENRQTMFPINTPHSKEEMYYRQIFEKYYKGMDKFVHVWEGGCRAGGAPWKNEAYTREGLKDVKQLAKGLGLDTTIVDEHKEKLLAA
jgi:asparagine synthase (glutamine-hydrolysing)